jgi:hypothetical protein
MALVRSSFKLPLGCPQMPLAGEFVRHPDARSQPAEF